MSSLPEKLTLSMMLGVMTRQLDSPAPNFREIGEKIGYLSRGWADYIAIEEIAGEIYNCETSKA